VWNLDSAAVDIPAAAAAAAAVALALAAAAAHLGACLACMMMPVQVYADIHTKNWRINVHKHVAICTREKLCHHIFV